MFDGTLASVGGFLGAALSVAVAYGAYYIAGLFLPKSKIEMPKAGNYPIQVAMKGGPIPKVYGTDRVAGNVIWFGTLQSYTVRHEVGGGKGGGGGNEDVIETRYRRSFLLSLCEGPAAILQAWKGKDEILLTEFTTFQGDNNSGIRALTGESYGDYPDICCAFFEDYELGDSEALPNFTFLVASGASSYPILQVADGDFIARNTDPGFLHTTPVSDIDDLQAMAGSGHYYLTNDIDASATVGWNGGRGFIPIEEFKGSLDGCGYSITDFYQNAAGFTVNGIFEDISSVGGVKAGVANLTMVDATYIGRDGGGICEYAISDFTGVAKCIFYNIHFVNCTFTCRNDFGFICGWSIGYQTKDQRIAIKDCTVTGCTLNLTDSRFQDVGGLVGESSFTFYNNCRVIDTTFTKTVFIDKPTDIGGLVGYSYKDSFTDCAADVDISAGYYCGGLVGESLVSTFTRCSARGSILCLPDVDFWSPHYGGLVGDTHSCVFTDCYSWINIMSDGVGLDLTHVDVGGLLGEYSEETVVTNCYTKGYLPTPAGAEHYIGGVSGYTETTTFVSVYWDTDVSGESDGLATDAGENTGDPVGHVTSWMKNQSNFESAGWDFDDVWEMDNYDYVNMNPADIIEDIIENTRYGAGNTAIIDDTSLGACHDYWQAENMLLSITLSEQKPWIDWVDFILAHVGGLRFNSGGKLHFGVLKDDAAVAAITEYDLVRDDTENPPPAVDVTKRPRSETFNWIWVGWTNPDKRDDLDYERAFDPVDIRKHGLRKKTVALPGIRDKDQARRMAWRFLIDGLYRFGIYKFTVTFANMLLDKGDVISLSDGELLDGERVRIMGIEEDVNGRGLAITAMDDLAVHYPDVTSYQSQENLHTPDPAVTLADASVCFREDVTANKIYLSVVPGNAWFNGAYIYASRDNLSYSLAGRFGIDGVTGGDSNSSGTIEGSLPAHGSMTWAKDESVLVDIGTVTDLRTDVTEDEFWSDLYLARIGDEIIAFKTAEETAAPGVWLISNLRRGLFGTEPEAHAADETFCTLVPDFSYTFDPDDIGRVLYFKALVFYGSTFQDITDLTAASVTVGGYYLRPAAASLLRLTADENDGGGGSYSGASFTLYWNLGSRASGWNYGGWDVSGGGVPWNNYVADAELQAVVLKFEQAGGAAIGQREIAVGESATITKATDLGGINPAVIRVVPRRVLESRLENSLLVDDGS